ncbi:hypothetical protein M0812_14203 [Anaeramoeba flamelloides]|uniref:Uncharacterized protein n=1 Tax=Anaeramoeba flamelloides TaxID=1746091 RepID=A0AAV7ZJP9_9EUKA|nr:hypothetical protein M0812_14203 [Anaeramoeba flamelloides]
MCFNQPISGVISILGLLTCVYLFVFHRKKPGIWRLIVPTFYFTAMEILQFFQYFWIDQCENPINIGLTIVGWLHICFQPVVSNIMTTFTKPKRDKYIFKRYLIPLAFTGAIAGVSRLFFYNFQPCDAINDPLCGTDTCTRAGSVHLKWTLRLRGANYFTPSIFIHAFTMFVHPILFGQYVPFFIMILTGPFLAWYIGRDKDQWAAIWCYVSIFQVIGGIYMNLREYKDFIQKQKAETKKDLPKKAKETTKRKRAIKKQK